MANLASQFNASLRSGVVPMTVNFTNTSTGPFTSVRWDFGDGGQSSEINPSHQFTSDGVYQIKLVVYDANSGTSESMTTIAVYPNDNYTTGNTTQQALFTSKRFGVGQVAVKKTLVNGSAVSTQFPLSSATGAFATTLTAYETMNTLQISGSSDYVLKYNSANAAYVGIGDGITQGKDVYIGFFMHTGTTANAASSGHQMFIYKAVSRNTDLVTVDRPVVNISGTTPGFAGFYFTNVEGELSPGCSIHGLHGAPATDSANKFEYLSIYPSDPRTSGTFNYFSEDHGNGETTLFIMPTSVDFDTVERWKVGSTYLKLPYLLWHSKSTAGIELVDDTEVYRDPDNNLLYTNLYIVNIGTVVGRVFHEKKLITIDNQELIAALCYTSNRSYTLYDPVVTTTSTADGTGGFQSGVTYFVTYGLSDPVTAEYGNSAYFGSDYPMHCRHYQTITPPISGNKLRIQSTRSLWHTTSRLTGADTGFTATLVHVFIGSGTTSEISGVTTWHEYTLPGGTVDLYTGLDIPYPSAAKTTPVSIPYSGSSNLKFGQDPLIIGYFSALSQSTIYKMSATCVAKNNEFNTTQNPTFDETLNESVYITEVALYNENNELLMTGKLNTPIEKNDKKFVTIKMDLDL